MDWHRHLCNFIGKYNPRCIPGPMRYGRIQPSLNNAVFRCAFAAKIICDRSLPLESVPRGVRHRSTKSGGIAENLSLRVRTPQRFFLSAARLRAACPGTHPVFGARGAGTFSLPGLRERFRHGAHLILYDNRVVEIAEQMRASERSEREITSVNNACLALDGVCAVGMGRGMALPNTGTPNGSRPPNMWRCSRTARDCTPTASKIPRGEEVSSRERNRFLWVRSPR